MGKVLAFLSCILVSGYLLNKKDLNLGANLSSAPINNMAECGESYESIKAKMISESISRYPGTCPCPYFDDSAGRSCGKRSAWSKPGGYSPLCYSSDISDHEVESFCSSIRFR